jgi:putative ABC transport system ATP-binding protein
MEGQDSILYFRNVIKTRQGGTGYRLVIDEILINAKERIALIGDSGSGKSTILDMMALVLKPDNAEEFFFRSSPNDKWENLWRDWTTGLHGRFEKIRRTDLGYLLQTGGLLPFLSVRDNITLPASFKGSQSLSETKDYLDFLAVELKIEHLLKKYPTQISVGERQRCAIARALIHKPALVLADEPTASLDPPTADKVFQLLLKLCDDCALVVSTHEHHRVVGTGGFKVFRIDCRSGEPGEPITARVIPPDDYVSPLAELAEDKDEYAAPQVILTKAEQVEPTKTEQAELTKAQAPKTQETKNDLNGSPSPLMDEPSAGGKGLSIVDHYRKNDPTKSS